MGKSLHTKHRPRNWDQVVGQGVVVTALSKVIERKQSQAFLLAGPSGCGKTTLAYIAATKVGCAWKDVIDHNAAKYTGVDNMRELQEAIRYKPLGESSARVIIIDECHMLSKSAWNSLLKVVEDPPSHAFFFFCTTEPAKVPKTIKTRCTSYTLKSVAEGDLRKALKWVMDKESFKVPEDVLNVVVGEADGSPRQALVNLEQCRDAKTKKEAAEILRTALQSEPIRELCQFLLQGGSWTKAMAIVAKFADEHNAESVRIIVCNYMAAVLKGAKSDEKAVQVLQILEAFAEPYNQSEKMAPLQRSIGRVLFAGE